MQYKNPESILVVIFCPVTKRCLMLQRQDDANFWQSVTGSLENNETPLNAALREVLEETNIDIVNHQYPLIETHYSIEFDIFPQFLHRYAPHVRTNKEHWFYLPLPEEITPILTEHLDYQWLPFEQAAEITVSWNNKRAIEQINQYYST